MTNSKSPPLLGHFFLCGEERLSEGSKKFSWGKFSSPEDDKKLQDSPLQVLIKSDQGRK